MRAVLICALAAVASAYEHGLIYGLNLAGNSPAVQSLFSLDPSTGKATVVGSDAPMLNVTTCMGELSAVADGQYFYLGDTAEGTTLVAVDMETGLQTCSQAIPQLVELGYIGFGQTLDYDSSTDSLIISGLDNDGTHTVLKASASAGCAGPFETVGTYDYADQIPMLHGSTLDEEGQRMFSTVSKADKSMAIMVYDLTTGKSTGTIPLAPTLAPEDIVLGMSWDAKTNNIFGVYADGNVGLLLNGVNPDTGVWTVNAIDTDKDWNQLYGNEGNNAAFDPSSRTLFGVVGKSTAPRHGTLLEVNVDTAKDVGSPVLSGDLGISGAKGLLQLVFAP